MHRKLRWSLVNACHVVQDALYALTGVLFRPTFLSVRWVILLVARIARYRETVSEKPPDCALWGLLPFLPSLLVSQHGQLGAIPPPPFFERFPSGEHAKWRCDTPPPKGYLSDTCATPYENKANIQSRKSTRKNPPKIKKFI